MLQAIWWLQCHALSSGMTLSIPMASKLSWGLYYWPKLFSFAFKKDFQLPDHPHATGTLHIQNGAMSLPFWLKSVHASEILNSFVGIKISMWRILSFSFISCLSTHNSSEFKFLTFQMPHVFLQIALCFPYSVPSLRKTHLSFPTRQPSCFLRCADSSREHMPPDTQSSVSGRREIFLSRRQV